MASIKRFEDLQVWQRSMDLAKKIYNLSNQHNLDYYLKDQINKAALSLSNNIAEGFEYGNNNDFKRFLKYAKGLAGAVRNLLKLSNLIPKEDSSPIQQEILKLSKQLNSLLNYLKTYQAETQSVKEPEEPYTVQEPATFNL